MLSKFRKYESKLFNDSKINNNNFYCNFWYIKHERWNSVLTASASLGKIRMVIYAVIKGANKFNSALINSIQYGLHENTITYLLKKGAYPSQRAMRKCADVGSLKYTEYFREKGRLNTKELCYCDVYKPEMIDYIYENLETYWRGVLIGRIMGTDEYYYLHYLNSKHSINWEDMPEWKIKNYFLSYSKK